MAAGVLPGQMTREKFKEMIKQRDALKEEARAKRAQDYPYFGRRPLGS